MTLELQIKILGLMAVFTKVVECNSFSVAAGSLGKAASTVSRDVHLLEELLNVTLLSRTTRSFELTEAGRLIFEQSRMMMEISRNVINIAEQSNGMPRGLVRINTTSTIARGILQPHLGSFLQRYPEVSVKILTSDRELDATTDQVDLVIRSVESLVDGLVTVTLSSVRYILCATPQYLAIHGTPREPSDLTEHHCLYIGETRSDNQWLFKRGEHEVRVEVEGRYVINHSELRLQGVLEHFGIGALPHFTAERVLANGIVKQVLADWEFTTAYSGVAHIMYPRNRFLSPKVRAFIDHIREATGSKGDTDAHGVLTAAGLDELTHPRY